MKGSIISALAVLGALALIAGTVLVVARTASDMDDDEVLATLAGVFNEVTTLEAGQLAWEKGTEGAALRHRDSVRTAPDARAIVSYTSGATLNVDPDSLLVITAPRRDESGVEVQEVLVTSGGVRAEMPAGSAAGRRRVVEVVGESGEVAARLTPTGSSRDDLSYRVRLNEQGETEVAVLAGEAEVQSGEERVSVRAGQAVEIDRSRNEGRISAAVTLPGFPESLAPSVDAGIRIDSPPAEVELKWAPVEQAASYRVQVATDFTFDHIVREETVEDESYRFAVPSKRTYFWRVSSRDERGREGEFGFVRRFSVLSMPREQPEPETADTEETEEASTEPPPSIATDVEFDFVGRVLGQGLMRQARGRGNFRQISGRVELNARDVLQAERWSGIRLGRNSTLQLEANTRVELSRAGRRGGRRVLAVTLMEGGITTDLGRNADLASVLVESGEERITISGDGEGARVKTVREEDKLRFVAERGEASVWAGGQQYSLSQGQAIDRLDEGEVRVLDLPPNPVQSAPEDGANFVTLDSPPEIVMSWRPVEGASSYKVRILSEGRLFYQGMTRSPRLVHTALPPGEYRWQVHTLDENGLESLAPPARSFSVVRDDRPPQVTVSSPADGSTTPEESVAVSGSTEPGVRVKVNTRNVTVDADGRFSTEIDLQPGMNQIVIEAVNRANAVTFKNLRVRRE